MICSSVQLREVDDADLTAFYDHQCDPVSLQMAAFTRKEPQDRDRFDQHWSKILTDSAITVRTITFEGLAVGHILCHTWFGTPELSYWMDRAYWGQGIATSALYQFLRVIRTRPLYARVVSDNTASLRILHKQGFVHTSSEYHFSNARGIEVEEYLLVLK